MPWRRPLEAEVRVFRALTKKLMGYKNPRSKLENLKSFFCSRLVYKGRIGWAVICINSHVSVLRLPVSHFSGSALK